MTQFQITGAGVIDLRSTNLFPFDGLQFATSGNTRAQLNFGQLLGNHSITGNAAFADTVEIFVSGNYDASFLTFATWSPADLMIYRDSAGNNNITGSSQNDRIHHTGGSDTVDGGTGDDLLVINYSTTTFDVFGAGNQFNNFHGNFLLFADIERFDVTTGSGNDSFTLGAGNDKANGGAGNDTIRTGAGDAAVNGGAGSDKWEANLSAETVAITIDLAAAGINAIGGGSRVGNIEALDQLLTGSGNDVILTRTGNPHDGLRDNVLTGAGDDTIAVGGGSDAVNGGTGDDLLIIDYSTTTFGVFGTTNQFSDSNGAFVSIAGIERFDVKTGSGNDSFTLGAGNDAANGGAGNDTIRTGAGDATVNGGAGNDTWGADLSAETVAITIDLAAAGINAIGGGSRVGNIEAIDQLLTGSGNDVILTRIGNPHDGLRDNVLTGAGDDTIAVGGGNDAVNGGTGDDLLIIDYSATTFGVFGTTNQFSDSNGAFVSIAGIERFDVKTGSGNDSFTLGAGNDAANGGAGNDIILGGDGNDRITGGTQKDVLTGGLGSDIFDYDRIQDSSAGTANRDAITDFNGNAQDQIDLSTIDANADGGTTNDTFTFMGTAVFTGLGQIRFQHFDLAGTADDYTLVEINSSGTNTADMRIEIRGLVTLDEGDFIL